MTAIVDTMRRTQTARRISMLEETADQKITVYWRGRDFLPGMMRGNAFQKHPIAFRIHDPFSCEVKKMAEDFWCGNNGDCALEVIVATLMTKSLESD